MVRVEAVGYMHQADAAYTKAAPTSGDKYTVLDTTKKVRIISIMVKVTWTVQPTPIEVHITIDGNAIIHTQANPVSAQPYVAALDPTQDLSTQHLAIVGAADLKTGLPSFIYEGKTVKVEMETTGGTVSGLSGLVKYAVLRP